MSVPRACRPLYRRGGANCSFLEVTGVHVAGAILAISTLLMAEASIAAREIFRRGPAAVARLQSSQTAIARPQCKLGSASVLTSSIDRRCRYRGEHAHIYTAHGDGAPGFLSNLSGHIHGVVLGRALEHDDAAAA